MAKTLARQFGPNCEIVVHDLDSNDEDSSIVAIENGQVTGRKVGDGPSHVVLEALRGDREKLQDHLCYLTKTKDGRVLRSSTIFIREDEEDPASHPIGIISINYDITRLVAMEQTARPGSAETISQPVVSVAKRSPAKQARIWSRVGIIGLLFRKTKEKSGEEQEAECKKSAPNQAEFGADSEKKEGRGKKTAGAPFTKREFSCKIV